MPNSIARSKLSMAAKVVYASLSSRINCGAGNWPSHALLAEESSCSIATVKRALIELRDAGVVEWRQRSTAKGGQTSNEYRLIVSPPFQSSDGGAPF
jgi:DNA-binding transcriptional regulator YhcF (GntR family)